MNLIHDIPTIARDGIYRMVVENPKGVSGKYEIDKEFGIIGMDRVLAAPMPFLFEYGFFPQTWCECDDDPVDVMVILPISTFPGCLLEVRPVGLFKMVDTGKEDHKVLAVAEADDTFEHVKEFEDVPSRYLERIEFFWENYKDLSPDRSTEGQGWVSRVEAEKFISDGMKYYKKKFGKSHE